MSAWTCECGTVYDTDFRFGCPKCGRRFDSLEDDEMVKPDAITSRTMTEQEKDAMLFSAGVAEKIQLVTAELGDDRKFEDNRIILDTRGLHYYAGIKDFDQKPTITVWSGKEIRKPGLWLCYLDTLYEKARAKLEARNAEEEKAKQADHERRFGPVDDAALFPEFAEPAKPESDPNYRPPPPKPAMVDGFPRRGRVDLWCPAEKAIQAAVDAVEEAGADLLLTDAVILLGQAKDKVADWYEAQPKKD